MFMPWIIFQRFWTDGYDQNVSAIGMHRNQFTKFDNKQILKQLEQQKPNARASKFELNIDTFQNH